MTNAIDKTERIERVHYIRQWDTSEDAENTALSIIGLLPDNSPMLGIFPTGVDPDTDTGGDGGISFQRSTEDGAEVVTIVEIDSSGCMTGYRFDRSSYSQATISTYAQAADYLKQIPEYQPAQQSSTREGQGDVPAA